MKKINYSLAFGFCITFICVYIVMDVRLENIKDIRELYIGYYSFIPIGTSGTIIELIISVIHLSFLTYIFSSYISSELREKGVFIFTRTDRKENWLMGEYINIFIKLSMYYLIQFMFLFFVGLIFGFHVMSFSNFIITVLFVLIIQIISSFVLVILANTVSLFSNTMYGYLSSLIALCINMSIVSALYNDNNIKLIKYLPFSQHLILLNNVELVADKIVISSTAINALDIGMNMAICIFILIVLIQVGRRKIKSLDIM